MYNTDYQPQPIQMPGPPPRRRNRRLLIVSALAVVVAAATVFAGTRSEEEPAASAAVEVPVVTTTVPVLPAVEIATGGNDGENPFTDVSDLAAAVVPSIVTVQVFAEVNGTMFGSGSGSGVILDGEGRIVTNDHVVAVGDSFEVVLADGRIYPATLLGTDPVTDLAVLDIDSTELNPIEVGSGDALVVGDPAIAVGSPLGLSGGPSLTVGVLSAVDRRVQIDAETVLVGMLQTDAPITQGSSGGALVDDQGRLVGITTAVGVSSVGVEGIGFATPTEIMNRVVAEIIATGAPTEPFIGITGGTAFQDTADGGRRPVGVLVDTVQAGRAGEAAGIAPGDLITAMDGAPVVTMEALIAELRRYGAGDAVELTVSRNGADVALALELGNR